MDASYQGGVAYEERGESFQRLSSTIASNIKKISQNVSSMSKMVNQLQTPQDSQELRNQLRQIQHYTQKLAKDTSSMIMDLMKMPVEQPAGKLTRERLSDEYMATLNAFQATQKSAAQKTKEDVRKVKAQSATINIGDPFGMSVSSMSKMVNQLQTPQDSQELRNQLRQIQHYTQKLAKDTSSMIMDLMKMPVEQPAGKLTRERLSDEYMATLNAFQATQKSAAQKTKEDVRKVKAQSATINIGDPFGMSGRSNDLVEMEDKHRQEQVTMQSEQDLRQLEERERDIRQLESDILDVNQIFKELGTMIHDQGQVVDSIESSVEFTAHNVEAATQELRQASNYKNKLRKKKVYIAIVVVVIVSIILIIVFSR